MSSTVQSKENQDPFSVSAIWTATVRQLWLTGHEVQEIASLTGHSEEQVRSMLASNLTILLTQESRQKRQAAIVERFRKQGWSIPRLADRFGLTVSSIHKILRDTGEKTTAEHVTSETLRIIACLIRGRAIKDAATECGVSRQHINTIKQRAQDAGIFDAVSERTKAATKKK